MDVAEALDVALSVELSASSVITGSSSEEYPLDNIFYTKPTGDIVGFGDGENKHSTESMGLMGHWG